LIITDWTKKRHEITYIYFLPSLLTVRDFQVNYKMYTFNKHGNNEVPLRNAPLSGPVDKYLLV